MYNFYSLTYLTKKELEYQDLTKFNQITAITNRKCYCCGNDIKKLKYCNNCCELAEITVKDQLYNLKLKNKIKK